jgi:Uma2 family endonuclease
MSTARHQLVHRFTREEYHRLGELGFFHGQKVELVDGEILHMSPQESRHATAVRFTSRVLERLLGHRFEVRPQLPLALGPRSEPEPDVAVVPGRAEDYAEAHPTSALLVIEVADTTLAYDLVDKASLYASYRIEEYWVVDLTAGEIVVHLHPVDGRYQETRRLDRHAEISPICAPDVVVPVTELLP